MGLVLSRQLNDQIVLTNKETGEEITFTITRIRGKSVRVYTNAPPQWEISRRDAEDRLDYKAMRESTSESFKDLVTSKFGGIAAISPQGFDSLVKEIAHTLGRKPDTILANEVLKVLRELPSNID